VAAASWRQRVGSCERHGAGPGLYQSTPEQAFELLTRLSQTTHRKLRDYAADLVTSTAKDRPADGA
jgi:hypothetical protein